ncbi:hypothetical protein H0H93_008690, partial [Arthromyces matolae]
TLTLKTDPEDSFWMGSFINTAHPEVQIEVEAYFLLYPGTPIERWNTSDLQQFLSQYLDRDIVLSFIEDSETKGLVGSPAFQDVVGSRFPDLFRRGLINFNV